MGHANIRANHFVNIFVRLSGFVVLQDGNLQPLVVYFFRVTRRFDPADVRTMGDRSGHTHKPAVEEHGNGDTDIEFVTAEHPRVV